MKKYGFGVDIGGTTCKIGLFETTGVIIEKWEIPTRTDNHGENILSDVTDSVMGKMAEKGISKEDVQGVGIGVPGPVTAEGVVQKCVNLGWGVFDVVKEMTEKTGLHIKVGNDANVAALGEMWQGGGKGRKNMIMVTLGTGVGGGIIVDGKIVAGSHGAGGEIGHMTVNTEETEQCGCGRYGCLEQYASATGAVRLAKRKLQATDKQTVLRNYDPLTAKDIFDAAKAKDQVADEVVEEMTMILGKQLSDMACVVDPEIIVIGGGVSKAGTILTERIQKYYKKAAFLVCRNAEFALATLGNDAGMYGCVQMILQ